MARECYLTSVDTEKAHQTLMVEGRRNIVEPLEVMGDIALVTGDDKKTTMIGTTLSKEIRAELINFLKANADVFVWSHEDMPGISREMMAHKLNVNPSMYPVKQKGRVFAPRKECCRDGRSGEAFDEQIH